MFIIILGIIDLVVGIFLALSNNFQGSTIILYLGIIILLKALYSLGTAFGAGFYLDFLGILDLIAGILLLIVFYGIFTHFFIYIGILLALKGIYSIIMGLIQE
ncbi:MAG: hypothetical protein ISS36_04085 [Candidatus Aenigmarchaeota archaeon]|nr:hypothetical protein [Candidatus Aenigmarchaeota archaeon]